MDLFLTEPTRVHDWVNRVSPLLVVKKEKSLTELPSPPLSSKTRLIAKPRLTATSSSTTVVVVGEGETQQTVFLFLRKTQTFPFLCLSSLVTTRSRERINGWKHLSSRVEKRALAPGVRINGEDFNLIGDRRRAVVTLIGRWWFRVPSPEDDSLSGNEFPVANTIVVLPLELITHKKANLYLPSLLIRWIRDFKWERESLRSWGFLFDNWWTEQKLARRKFW